MAKRDRPGPPVAGVHGNWACPDCGNVNFGTRDACNRCRLQKPRAQPVLSYLATTVAPKSAARRAAGLWNLAGNVTLQDACRTSEAPVAGIGGNWACQACGNVNFAFRDACNRCHLPMQDMATATAAAGDWNWAWQPEPVEANAEATNMHRRGPPVAGVDGNWACSLCGNVNFASRMNCNMCQTQAQPTPGGKRTASGAPVAGVAGNWACQACNNINFPHRDACNLCAMPRQDSGKRSNWPCQGCGNLNFADREACNICKAPKWPQAAKKGQAPVPGVNGNWQCVDLSRVQLC